MNAVDLAQLLMLYSSFLCLNFLSFNWFYVHNGVCGTAISNEYQCRLCWNTLIKHTLGVCCCFYSVMLGNAWQVTFQCLKWKLLLLLLYVYIKCCTRTVFQKCFMTFVKYNPYTVWYVCSGNKQCLCKIFAII